MTAQLFEASRGDGGRRPQLLSPVEAMDLIHSDDLVYVASGLGHPDRLAQPLVDRARTVGRITILTSLLGDNPPYCAPELLGICKVLTFRGTRASESALEVGQAEVLPMHLSSVGDLVRDVLTPDVALIQVTGPDEHGRYSLGASVLYQRSVIRAARTVIAEINPELPRANGDSVLQAGEIDVVVPGGHTLPTVADTEPTQDELAVAERVVTLIPDGATVQVGIGGVGDAVMRGLRKRRNLRIHTGLVNDSVLSLLDSGALASGRHTVVCGSALGSPALYEQIARDDRFLLRGVDFTHSVEVMSRIPAFIAVNSGIELDLAGQLNGETVNGRPISGTGGQSDFLRGAWRSPGGLGIVAMTSHTPTGRPRIVDVLGFPGTVSTLRSDISLVVTERGHVDLRMQGLRSRAEALRAIS